MKLFILFCSVLFVPSLLWAEGGPEVVLGQVMNKLKSSGDTTVVIEYVDWESAYQRLSPDQRKMMSINSSADFKSFYQRMLSNPGAMLDQQLSQQMANMPAEQQAAYKAQIGRMRETLTQKLAEAKTKITNTVYQVGKSTVEGETAKVELVTTYEGKSETRNVNMVKKAGQWLLASPDIGRAPQQQAASAVVPPAVRAVPSQPSTGMPATVNRTENVSK